MANIKIIYAREAAGFHYMDVFFYVWHRHRRVPFFTI